MARETRAILTEILWSTAAAGRCTGAIKCDGRVCERPAFVFLTGRMARSNSTTLRMFDWRL